MNIERDVEVYGPPDGNGTRREILGVMSVQLNPREREALHKILEENLPSGRHVDCGDMDFVDNFHMNLYWALS